MLEEERHMIDADLFRVLPPTELRRGIRVSYWILHKRSCAYWDYSPEVLDATRIFNS